MEQRRNILPYGRQWIDEEDIAAVVRVLKSPFLTQGPAVEEFEQALCAYTGAKYCVTVANGTAALHLAVAALNISTPSSGITSPITFIASANALVYNKIRPLFADIDKQTANMSPVFLEKTLQSDSKVVIPVHFSGNIAPMQEISKIARKQNCLIIEDAAHALGARYSNGDRVGSNTYSDMTIFSFHPLKTITTGEGGAVTTNDLKLYERLCRLRSHGITKDPSLLSKSPGPWYHEMQELGFNYRLTDIQAALGVSQLKKIDRFINRRRDIVAQYDKAFAGCKGVTLLSREDRTSAHHLYVLLVDFVSLGKNRKQIMEGLYQQGIGTQVHYIPVYDQPFYKENFNVEAGSYPNAQSYYEQCLSLPLYPAMTEEDVQRVIAAIKKEIMNKI
jgi:UDP-4-amino-4,6-dideoxy-N-acetyl-beta-L-altrosamine transaminase